MSNRTYEWDHPDFLKSIQFEKKNDTIFITRKGQPLQLSTPELRLPFGVDKNYNGLQMKLQCNHWDETENDHKKFIEFIRTLEQRMCEILGITRDLLPSQVSFHPKFPPIISTKVIVNRGNTIGTEIIDCDKTPVNIFNIEKGEIVACKLLIDSIRPYKGKFWYKLKCKKVVCVKRH